MAVSELTLKNYQKQLKDGIRDVYENFMDILKCRTDQLAFDIQVKTSDMLRAYQSLMSLTSEIRTLLIINDEDDQQAQDKEINNIRDKEKLIKLRDDMAMFLYELEIPLP